MPKMKISGATPSHPIPPPSCSSSNCVMFKRSERTSPQKTHTPTSAAQAVISPSFAQHRDLDRLRPGFLQLAGVLRGDLRFRSRLEASRKTRLFPKSNRMPYLPHSVKVETQVVEGIQDLRQNFIGCIEMATICAGVAPASPAAAIGVERVFVLDITRLFNGNPAFGSKEQPVARRARRKNAIHHIDTKAGVLNNFLRRAHSHQVAGLVGGKMLEGTF